MAGSPAERHPFCRKALFRQREALSAEYGFQQKFIILKQALSAIGRERKNLFRLISTKLDCAEPYSVVQESAKLYLAKTYSAKPYSAKPILGIC